MDRLDHLPNDYPAPRLDVIVHARLAAEAFIKNTTAQRKIFVIANERLIAK